MQLFSKFIFGARLYVVVLLLLFFSENAHAYLDPGTGSYLLQLLIAGLLGALFVIKMFFFRIKETLKRLFSRGTSDSISKK